MGGDIARSQNARAGAPPSGLRRPRPYLRRTKSAATVGGRYHYAADTWMPGSRRVLLAALVAVFVGVDRVRFRKIVLDVAVVQLFAGNSCGLQGSRVFDHGRRSGHDLPGAP